LTPPPPFILQLLGWDRSRPNIADGGMKTSVAIATHMFSALHVTRATSLTGQQVGAELESEIELFLSQELPKLDPSRAWDVKRCRVVSDFDQYAHIA
jgi:hypothetical protein